IRDLTVTGVQTCALPICVIKGDAGDAFAGKWDVAKIPGGGGNWGGSFLAVPTQSKHQKAAVELVKFLTSKDGQIAAWKAKGNLRSEERRVGKEGESRGMG